jgi:nitroimidazol reductase NimA-like FMN-containing flavoprotein (pyridoxamine 5'-phosphate oxidase superfamily)
MIGDRMGKVDYPQLPPMTNDELASLFQQAEFARLATLNEDGTIHVAPIFFRFHDG